MRQYYSKLFFSVTSVYITRRFNNIKHNTCVKWPGNDKYNDLNTQLFKCLLHIANKISGDPLNGGGGVGRGTFVEKKSLPQVRFR